MNLGGWNRYNGDMLARSWRIQGKHIWWLGFLAGITSVAIAALPEAPAYPAVVRGIIETAPEPIQVEEPAQDTAALPEVVVTDTQPAPAPLRLRVRRGDALSTVLQKQGIEPEAIQGVIAACNRRCRQIRPGEELELKQDSEQKFLELRLPVSLTQDRVIRKTTEGFVFTTENHQLAVDYAHVAGSIQDSLYLDAQRAGLTDRLIIELAEIFAWDIDFAHDIRSGDRFAVIYEEKYKQGHKVTNGDIVAAEFTVQGQRYRAVGFRDDQGRLRYYTPEGESLRRSFLRSPVEFSRISSGYTLKRYHPLLKRNQAHKGVDYAAATGTPVRSTAQGRIAFRGRKGGYGNVVIVQHADAYSTLYAHLSAFARHQRVGATVQQGQVVGYVGSTGMSTGPHLHYEFRVHGEHRNPLTYQFPKAESIAGSHRARFLAETRIWNQRLADIGQQRAEAGTGGTL